MFNSKTTGIMQKQLKFKL